MKRPSKLRTKIALAGGVAVLAGSGLFAASAANATPPAHHSHSFQVADSGQATAGKPAPSSAPATVGLPQGGQVAKGTLLPSTPGSSQVTSPNASATDVAAATWGAAGHRAGSAPNAADSLKTSDSGQATAGEPAPSSVPATVGLPQGGVVAKGTPALPNTPGSVQGTSGNADSAGDSAPAQSTGSGR